MSQKAKWYVVHTFSGHEKKVKANIEKLVENRGMDDVITEVRVPLEEKIEIKDGKKKSKKSKLFPGYVIVKMIVNDESWYLVRNTRGVTGFVGPSSKPIPLTDKEVKNMGLEKVTVNAPYSKGDTIKVTSGPFKDFVGKIQEVYLEKTTFKVLISMFGRETPVELTFDQVKDLD